MIKMIRAYAPTDREHALPQWWTVVYHGWKIPKVVAMCLKAGLSVEITSWED